MFRPQIDIILALQYIKAKQVKCFAYVYSGELWLCSTYDGQKRASDPLELKIVMSCWELNLHPLQEQIC